MKNLKKSIFRILLGTILILILLVGFFIFVINKNEVTEFDRKSSGYEPTVVKFEKTTPEFNQGKEIFATDCNACHPRGSIINNSRMVKGIMNEMGIDYLKKFITNQDSLTTTKDIYATRIKGDYGNVGNSHNFEYSNTELNNLIEYIKSEK